MMARTHVPIGVAASMLIAAVLNKQIDMVYVSATVVGSLMPDADHPKSMINQKLPIKTKYSQTMIYTVMVVYILYKYMNTGKEIFLVAIPPLIMLGLSKHRGVSHSLLGTMLIAITALKFNSLIPGLMIPFVIGYVAHIIADCFTDKGVMLLWPNKRKIKFFVTISTGSYSEEIIAIGAVGVSFLLFIKLGSYQMFF